MMDIVWSRMTSRDVAAVAELERASFTDPWSARSFGEEADNPLAYYLVGRSGAALIAYAGMWIVLNEAHVTNVAVASAWRGQGVGERLMRRLLSVAAEKGAASMTLEVRPSNASALRLYERLGFVRAGLRKNYYEDTHEDAVIMWLRDEAFQTAARFEA